MMGIGSSDVMASYNRKDLCDVKKVCSRLRDNGIGIWLDMRRISPGEIWRLAIEEAIRDARIALVMIGPAGIGRTQQSEVSMCLTKAERTDFRLIPVLLPDAVTSDLPFISFLKNYAWVDFRDGINDHAFRDLICSIENRPLDPLVSIGDDSRNKNRKPTVSPLGLVWAHGAAAPRLLGLASAFNSKEFVTGAETRQLAGNALINGEIVEVIDSTGGRHRILFALQKVLSPEFEFGILQSTRHGLGVFRKHDLAGDSEELEVAILPSFADKWKPTDPWMKTIMAARVEARGSSIEEVLFMETSKFSFSFDGAPAFDLKSQKLVGILSRSTTGQLFVVSTVGLEKSIKKPVRS